MAGKGSNSEPYYGGEPAVDIRQEHVGRNGGYCSGGGGADFVYRRNVAVTPGAGYSITIGKGGAGGHPSLSGKGGDGILTIEWWK
ncbi:glycine-rich domain-containing protein [Lysinibacillus parviboronicapiens]|uniref:glycine-rich domain-containing protein n=1 Tax=Lysinibacillus parviboronicapiens TaxID=436516 RepID=UPI000D3AE610|nr:hypothetical protein [Lysinibacillus parviboronicapiens]